MSEYNYYKDQLKKIDAAEKYGVHLKLRTDKDETNWFMLNNESIPALQEWLNDNFKNPYNEPLILSVNYDLAFAFRAKAEAEGAEVTKVIEVITCKVLQYWFKPLPKEKADLITDFGFHTYIKNPVFQKYYHNEPAFKEIANNYIKEMEVKNGHN